LNEFQQKQLNTFKDKYFIVKDFVNLLTWLQLNKMKELILPGVFAYMSGPSFTGLIGLVDLLPI